MQPTHTFAPKTHRYLDAEVYYGLTADGTKRLLRAGDKITSREAAHLERLGYKSERLELDVTPVMARLAPADTRPLDTQEPDAEGSLLQEIHDAIPSAKELEQTSYDELRALARERGYSEQNGRARADLVTYLVGIGQEQA